MTANPLLGAVVALVAWSLIMLGWLAAVRLPALRRAGIRPPDGSRGADLERLVPGKPNWPAHNYMHLMEQPTLFYAIVFALTLMGASAAVNVALAWAYVAFRIAHSVVQATVNRVSVRFTLFGLSTLCLLVLTVNAAALLIRG